MAGPLNFDAFLGWVNVTDPNNIPPDARVLSADDLLRYEQFGIATTEAVNGLAAEVEAFDSDSAVAESLATTSSATRAAVQAMVDDGVEEFQAVVDAVPAQVDTRLAAEVPTRVAAAIAADNTVATAAAAAVTNEIAGRELVEGGDIVGEDDLAFSITDEDGRRLWIESDYDGSPSDYSAGKIVDKIGPDLIAEAEQSIGIQDMNTEITGLSFAIVDEDGRVLPDSRYDENGFFLDEVVASLKSRLGLGAIGSPDAFKASYQDTTFKMVSGPDITCWGDSMTAGAGGNGTNYPAVLAALTGRTVYNRGVGGESSVTIAQRAGAYALEVLPVNGVIPPSGIVEVTIQGTPGHSGARPLKQGSASYPTGRLQLLDGTTLPGTLSRTTHADGVTDVYWFTRTTAGSEIVLNRPVPFLSADIDARRGDITLIWIGQNGPSNERAIQDAHSIIRNLTPAQKRYIVIPKPTSSDADDTRWFEEFGDRVLLIRQYLVKYGLQDAGITPTPTDVTDIAAGRVPESLRSDSTHWTATGYTLLAQQMNLKLREMGWV